jgi:hypothetical protein
MHVHGNICTSPWILFVESDYSHSVYGAQEQDNSQVETPVRVGVR